MFFHIHSYVYGRCWPDASAAAYTIEEAICHSLYGSVERKKIAAQGNKTKQEQQQQQQQPVPTFLRCFGITLYWYPEL